MARRLLLGSNNNKKRKELEEILGEEASLRILLPSDLGHFPSPVEDGKTFEENAAIKALHYHKLSGLPVLADDSGLQVDALDGEPGIYSARYAGEDAGDLENNRKLLHKLTEVPDELRSARFFCVIVVVDQGAVIGSAMGTCEGVILREMRGTRGFGYDPVFFYPPEEKTFAELSPSVKNRVSHRANALRRIRPVLQTL
jgi:XTP/dITP diphosphohydrolase